MDTAAALSAVSVVSVAGGLSGFAAARPHRRSRTRSSHLLGRGPWAACLGYGFTPLSSVGEKQKGEGAVGSRPTATRDVLEVKKKPS